LRPTVFVGSSVEGLAVAQAIQRLLDHACQAELWTQGTFQLTRGTLESLDQALERFDFAVFALIADDVAVTRGTERSTVRDNVIFEAGLFIGFLGRDRVFMVADRSARASLPSDLAGVTLATFEAHTPHNVDAALGASATRIGQEIERLGMRPRRSEVKVFARRIDARDDISPIVTAERQELSIIAGTLGGTFRVMPDILDLLDSALSASDVEIRILLSHPSRMAERSHLEGLAVSNERQLIKQKLHVLFEQTAIPLDNIRFYNFPPTCTAVIAHGQRKLLLNPYTLGAMAENTVTFLLDGATHPDAYEGFVDAHLERPWANLDLSVSAHEFVEQENEEVLSGLAATLVNHIGERTRVVAVNGCTAVGKTQLARALATELSRSNPAVGPATSISCVHLETDGWLKLGREERLRRGLTGFDDAAYDIVALRDAIERLSRGEDARGPRYDHKSGIPGDSERCYASADCILVDGLMSTHPQLRDLVSHCIWVGASRETHRDLRLARDVNWRGYTPEGATLNWDAHDAVFGRFERRYRPRDENTIYLRANRAGMFIAAADNANQGLA
jgi:uridine kinase